MISKVTVTKLQADHLTQKVCAHWHAMETSWFALGRLVDECFRKGVPAALGMTAKAWMDKYLPGSNTRAFRALRITRALQGVPERQVKEINEGNALKLVRLPEKERKSKDWIEKALVTPSGEFGEAVDSFFEKKGVAREDFVTMHVRLPRAVYDKLEEAVQHAANAFSIDILENPGRRIQVWEAIALLVLGLNSDTLRTAVQGRE